MSVNSASTNLINLIKCFGICLELSEVWRKSGIITGAFI
jgi:hypothetical protein